MNDQRKKSEYAVRYAEARAQGLTRAEAAFGAAIGIRYADVVIDHVSKSEAEGRDQ